MNVFLREIRANFKSLLIWSGIVISFSLIGFSKFSAFYGNPELLAILDSMPPAVLSTLNMNAFNLTTVSGFFGVMIMYFGLILCIAAVMWGSDVVSKEERDRTVEFSLTLPVSRSRLISGKLVAVAVNCVLLTLVTWGITLVSAQSYQPTQAFSIFVAVSMLAFLLMQSIFLALGFFLGCALKHYKRASSTAMSVILFTYFLSLISGLREDLKFLNYFTPFKYFDPVFMMRESRLEITFVLLSVGLAIVLVIGAYFSYSQRDLYI